MPRVQCVDVFQADLGDRTGAVTNLTIALKRGYPLNLIEAAPDLLALRRDARYQSLLIDMERNRTE